MILHCAENSKGGVFRVEFELRLPDIGEGVAEGEIVAWLVAEGTPVKEDDLLVEILTDKAEMEMPSPRKTISWSRY
jgi:pyruvate/2-oxoglutarate dehydrogenase complex dihydrolipoamide acyltransferase (E2) component